MPPHVSSLTRGRTQCVSSTHAETSNAGKCWHRLSSISVVDTTAHSSRLPQHFEQQQHALIDVTAHGHVTDARDREQDCFRHVSMA